MTKFMILYNSTATAREVMANATPEQMQASMQEWIEWRNAATPTAKIEFGLPLQAVGQVMAEGARASSSHIGGYSIAECDTKEALLELLKTHPQLKRPGAAIEVLEMLPMPGLNTPK